MAAPPPSTTPIVSSTGSRAAAPPVGTKQYALSTGEKGAHRLRELNKCCNPLTLRFLASLFPDMRGMRVLDVGCGLGIVTNLLSQLVDPTGSVTAIDNSDEQLAIARTNVKGSNVRFLNVNLLPHADIAGLLNERYDLIYGRFIYVHLQYPYEVLELLMPLLNPGGVVLCEESSCVDVMFAEPPSPLFEKFRSAVDMQLRQYKGDHEFGRKLYGFFHRHQYQVMALEFVQLMLATEGAKTQLWHGINELRDMLIETKWATNEEIDKLVEGLQGLSRDPFTLVGLQQYAQIAARKPYPVRCARVTQQEELDTNVKPLFISTLAENILAAGEMDQDRATSHATKRFSELLPNGIQTANHYIYAITLAEPEHPLPPSAATNAGDTAASATSTVGYAWYRAYDEDGERVARLALIHIYELHRRKQYGYAAVKQLEPMLIAEVRVTKLQARAYKHNAASLGLIKKLGFVVVPHPSTADNDKFHILEKTTGV